MTLISEMRPCDSCEQIIQDQFKQMFPNIELDVKYGVEFKTRASSGNPN
ncbi:MAG: deaminase domain-containing protein [Prochloraceae cyanobacterium]